MSASLIRSNLDGSQKEFCAIKEDNIRLLAPAGSGKTYSLLWRCLNLFEANKSDNPRFLIFTFTRAARDELRDRLKTNQVFAPMAGNIEIMTLNSWGQRRLKGKTFSLKLISDNKSKQTLFNNTLQPIWIDYPKLKDAVLNSRKNATLPTTIIDLIDEFKSIGFRHDIHTDFAAFDGHVNWLQSNGLYSYFEEVASTLSDLEIVPPDRKNWRREVFENFYIFWAKVCEFMRKSSYITFEDQKYWPLVELEEMARAGKTTTGIHRYDHILVDEFQDINILDLNLLKAIASVNKTTLTIIGDDDQAIFEWRGATPAFIVNPDRFLGRAYHTQILKINYRSPKNIVDLSQKLIKNNKNRVKKEVVAASEGNASIEVCRNSRLEDTVKFVVDKIQNEWINDKELKKIGLISRKRGQILPYQIVFASKGLPFYAAEDLNLWMSEAFKNLIEALNIKLRIDSQIANSSNEIIENILGLCDKVKRYPLSKKDRDDLRIFLLQNHPNTFKQCIDALYSYPGTIKKSAIKPFWEAIVDLVGTKTVSESLNIIGKRFDGFQKDYAKSIDDIYYADPPFVYLSEFANRYKSRYSDFIQHLTIAMAQLPRAPGDEDQNDDWKKPIQLMTALRAKGKEFDVVVILDCNEGIWPSKLATTPEELESERRLFYVAFTRVRKKLLIVVNETILGEQVMPSPFLAEMGL